MIYTPEPVEGVGETWTKEGTFYLYNYRLHYLTTSNTYISETVVTLHPSSPRPVAHNCRHWPRTDVFFLHAYDAK